MYSNRRAEIVLFTVWVIGTVAIIISAALGL